MCNELKREILETNVERLQAVIRQQSKHIGALESALRIEEAANRELREKVAELQTGLELVQPKPFDPDEPIMIECPQCGAVQQDFDGFGVVHCEACGYCVHVSSTGGVCDICGAVLP